METYILTDEQRRELNEIFVGINRKYRNMSSESHMLDAVPRITLDEAIQMAEAELAGRHLKIENDYADKIDQITANAEARGMLNSSIYLQQMERAYDKKQEMLDRLANLTDKMAKKIVADNRKLLQSVEKEKSYQRSRALRDMVAVQNMTLKHSYSPTTLIEDEVYSAYHQWLLKYDANTAYEYVAQNNLFLHNLGAPKRNALLSDMNFRRLNP